MKYAGFWRRFGAHWLDILCLAPLTASQLWLAAQYRLAHLILLLPATLFGIWYSVYLVKRYGGTPGKLILGMRIAKVDGSPVGYREATLRYLPILILGTLVSLAFVLASLKMSDEEYSALGWLDQFVRLQQLVPSWYRTLNILQNIWIWSEFVVLLTNAKRRAIHDYLAGTVVILKDDGRQPVPAGAVAAVPRG